MVTEEELWNAQYEFVPDNSNQKVASIKEESSIRNLEFRPVTKDTEHEVNYWFKGNAWCINIFDGTKNANGFGVEIKDVN